MLSASALTLTFGLLCLPPPEPSVSAADLGRFPPMAVVSERVRFAREHGAWLTEQARMQGWQGGYWPQRCAEARELYLAWEALYDAHAGGGNWPRDTRLKALHDLRYFLGRDAYWQGQMPPCVPVWRFRWRDD